MRVTIEAGAEIEVATPAEVRREVARALSRVPSVKELTGSGVMPASGNLVISLEPLPAGQTWDLRRLTITPADPTSSLASARAIVFKGRTPITPSQLDPLQSIEGITGLPATFYWARHTVQVQGTERIYVVVLAGPTATTNFAAIATAVEVLEAQVEQLGV